MKFLRAISNLPWWCGLPTFLFGNLIVPYGITGYVIGLCICLFGCWVFSKLVKRDEYSGGLSAVMGVPIFGLLMFFINEAFIPFNWDTLYVIRSCAGLFVGLLAFEGFVK
jgi:hypothetical protein|tara:strand:+ start:3319 stop:3648 length:330 start_codon:yes stop_codon:yes gene_type:complete